jgi:tetratricopeptide (TPR) repeat protein
MTRTCKLLMIACCAAPLFAGMLFAGVDDEWKELYNQALRATAVKNFPLAEITYAKALHEAEVFGGNDIRVASTSLGMAAMYRAEKKLPEAETAAHRAVDIYAVRPGEDSLDYGQAQISLAAVLNDEGKYDSSLVSTRKALPILEKNLGPDSVSVADGICLQGGLDRQLKLYASAEAPLKRCAELRLDDGGPTSPEFGEAANNIAIVYQHLGRLGDADKQFKVAEAIRESSFGLMSPELAETLEAHAALLHEMGRDAEAKTKERMAASIRAHAPKK